MFRNYYLTNYSSHGSSSDWPQRITTICVGVPILWVLFSYAGTRQSFFQGTHAIMCWEWIQLTGGSTSYRQAHDPGGSSGGSSIAVGGGMGFMIVSILLVNIRDPALFQVAWIAALALSYLFDAASAGNHQVSTANARHRPVASTPTPGLGAAGTGLVLITVPCRAWLMLQENFHHTVSLLLVVWNGDTAALLAGRVWRQITFSMYRGYNPHSPVQGWLSEPPWLRRISPSKSVVGCLCGILGATWTFCVLPAFWDWIHRRDLAPPSSVDDLRVPLLFPVRSTTPSSWDASSKHTSGAYTNPVVIGLSLGVAGILGDLWESAVKRAVKAKDTGTLLPGHGGVLDRFDSTLVAVLLYQYYVEQGII